MQKHALPILFFTIFLDMLGLGILLPVLPVLMVNPLSPHFVLPRGTSVDTGYILLGILTAIYSLGIFIASPIIGQFSDKFGRKKLLMLSIAGSIFGHLMFAFAILFKIVPLLFAARFFSGLSGGNIVVAQAAIADITTPENRAKNFGLMGAAFGLGFVVGPFVGGKLADSSIVSWFGASTPFWFAAIMALCNFFFVATMFKETHLTRNADLVVAWGKALNNIAHAFTHKTLLPIFTSGFFYQAGFAFYVTFSAVFLYSRFGFTEGSIGNYFAYVGAWIVFTQMVITRLLGKHFSETAILRWSLLGSGVCIMAVVFAPFASLLYFIVPFFALSVGLSQANLLALLSRRTSKDIQGEVLGINGSLNALGTTLPPLIAGPIAATLNPSAPLVVASLIILLAGCYFIVTSRRTLHSV